MNFFGGGGGVVHNMADKIPQRRSGTSKHILIKNLLLKSYIAIFSTTKHKFMAILVELKANNLAP